MMETFEQGFKSSQEKKVRQYRETCRVPISISKFSEGIENVYNFAFRTEHIGIGPSLLVQNIPKGVHKDSFIRG